jgi:hypothetical protein
MPRLCLLLAPFGFACLASLALAGPTDEFFANLQPLCGKAYEGKLVEGSPSDQRFKTERLIMHVRQCSSSEIRIPFHIGDDHSRTWVLTRSANSLRLKHDHRHRDGKPESDSMYGGDSRPGGTNFSQDFPADMFTAQLIPAAANNVWRLDMVPGKVFRYQLTRDGRRIRIEFDLTQTVSEPPPPWGAAP